MTGEQIALLGLGSSLVVNLIGLAYAYGKLTGRQEACEKRTEERTAAIEKKVDQHHKENREEHAAITARIHKVVDKDIAVVVDGLLSARRGGE